MAPHHHDHHRWSSRFLLLLVLVLSGPGTRAASSDPPITTTTTTTTTTASRDVTSLSEWALQQGLTLHPALEWKHYGGTNWGFQLKETVPKGTRLMSVPRDLVLEAGPIRRAFEESGDYTPAQFEEAVTALGKFDIHQANFWIVCQLRKCDQDPTSRWTPWIRALPKSFPEFSQNERECLPFYARYAVDYLDEKFDAFCKAAAVLKICNVEDADDVKHFKWAFQAVGSRFWTTQPTSTHQTPITELCPVGDMYNHREPSNVQVLSNENGPIDFIYKGPDSHNPPSRDLFITYGQPSNPHRFLAIFGFVPTDMPYVWSHLTFSQNPFSDQAALMVFRTHDGAIPKFVWDAVLYALLDPPPATGDSSDELPVYTVEQHAKYRKHTLGILLHHVQKQLDELTTLKQTKIDKAPPSANLELIQQHNTLLTTVFSKVLARLQSGDPAQMMVVDDADFRVE